MKRLRLIAAALCLLAANVIPVAASEGTDLPKVIDDAEILSDYDETRLSSQIDEMTQQYQIDIVLMTENRRQEGTAQAEADMQYVNRGYGIGEGKDGILFLPGMGNLHQRCSHDHVFRLRPVRIGRSCGIRIFFL